MELYIVLGANGRNFEHLQQEHRNAVPGLPLLLSITVHCNLHATDGGGEEKRLNIVILFWEILHICYCLQVRLLNPDTQAQCIGTRIKPQWVLTAANCNPR